MDTHSKAKAPNNGATAHNGAQRRKRHRAANGSGYLVKRRGIWTARWKVAGRIISQSLHTADRAEAEAKLARLSAPRVGMSNREGMRKIASALAATLDDVSDQVRAASIPISQLYELWLDSPVRGRAQGRTLHSYRHQLQSFQAWLATAYPEIRNARDVSQVVAEEYIRHRRATRSPGTVSKDLNLLCAVWRALAARYGLDYNPWSPDRISRPAATGNSRRALTPAECDALLDAATPVQRLRILLSLDAGLRLGDIVRLRWSEVDLRAGIISRVTAKTGARIVNPISVRLAAALRAHRKAHRGEPLFPEDLARLRPDGSTELISEEMTALFRRAGISTRERGPDGTERTVASFHSLRHTFVSRLMERGVNPYYIQRAVGHSTMMMTAHYDHSAAEEIRKALEAPTGRK